MGNAAGCASTNSVQPQQQRYKDSDGPPSDVKTPPQPHQERSSRDDKANVVQTNQSSAKEEIGKSTRDDTNVDPQHHAHETVSSNEAFESSVIVEIPKGKSLKYITCKDLHQDKETELMRVLYRMDDVIAYNTHQLMETEFMLCVFSNVDKNIVIYTLSDGFDKFYYHIRDAESIHQDKFMVFEDSPSKEKEQLGLFIKSLQNCISSTELTIEPQPDETIEIFQKLKSDVGKVVTIALHLYPLKHNIDINIRDTFMMITKHSKQAKENHEKERKDDMQRQHSLEKELMEKRDSENKLMEKKDSEKNLTVEVLHLSRSSKSDENSPAHTPVTPEQAHPTSQVNELVSSLKTHDNEEVRNLVARIELILSDPTAASSAKSPLASLLVSKASSANMGLKTSVKDILTSDEHDSETQKWLNSEVLHGSLVEDDTDLSWKKKIKAYTKALVFTNYLKEMSSAARKSAKDSLELPKDDIPPKIREYLKDNLYDYFKFDVFEFNKIAEGEPLYYSCLYIFQQFDLIGPLNIPLGTLKKFLKEVESNYKQNPYHNNCHATDVVQTAISLYVKCFAETGHVENNLNFHLVPLDILALVVACLAHDVCHPGVTNLYEKKTRSERAIMFNDRSILENFHCYNLFKILGKEEFNIFVNMSTNQYDYLRELIVEMILATDISQHFLIVGQIKSNDIFNREKFSIERKECLLALLKVLIKCADVSNPTKSYHVYGKWVNRVMTEFYNQGDTERKLKLDISPFMDRNSQNVPKCQTGFIEFIVLPLFNLLFDFKPEETEQVKKQIQFNHTSMQDLTKANQTSLDLVLENVKQVTQVDVSIIDPLSKTSELTSTSSGGGGEKKKKKDSEMLKHEKNDIEKDHETDQHKHIEIPVTSSDSHKNITIGSSSSDTGGSHHSLIMDKEQKNEEPLFNHTNQNNAMFSPHSNDDNSQPQSNHAEDEENEENESHSSHHSHKNAHQLIHHELEEEDLE